ncbi:MAG: hypothetical protein ABIB79_03450 [archaeon]
MTEETKGRAPDFSNSQQGVAVWVNESKAGEKYLSIQILGQIKLLAFKNNPKPVVVTANQL